MSGPSRKVTIQDTMIVVAATAITIAWTRGAAEDILQRSTEGVPPGIRFPLLPRLMWWIPIPLPTLVSGTIAVLSLRLRQPRPAWRRLAYQPGAVACAGVALVLALQVVLAVIGIGLKQIPGMTFAGSVTALPSHWVVIRTSTDAGLAVIGSWLILAWGRRWMVEASWVDRAGRLIGACWIAQFLVQRTLAFMMAA